MNSDMIKFDIPKNQSSYIKVVGVGGGGSNAVNYMFKQGIEGVDFIVCNTDSQALDGSPVPNKIQLGVSLTEGRGAGSVPAVGRNAAIEDLDRIKEILEKNTKMIFITAGMGGGTGTGAAPVIAKACKDMDILTVGIVTIPFAFEGRKRRQQAEEGIRELKENVDALIIICNDKLRELYGNLSISDAFSKADNVLTTAAKGIAEIITFTGGVNVDFADVRTVMSNSGVAIMGSGSAEGDNRAYKAVEMALASPLLNDNNIRGASNILLNILSGKEEILMDEITEITDYIQSEAGSTADIIWGCGRDENLGNKINVIIVATGFGEKSELGYETHLPVRKNIHVLEPPKAPEEKYIPENQEDDQGEMRIITRKETHGGTPGSTGTPKPAERTSQHEPIQRIEVQAPIDEGLFAPKFVKPREEEIVPDPVQHESYLSREQMAERERRLRELSMKIKTPDGLQDLEKEPAYKRRNVALNSVPAGDVSHVSRYTLTEGEGKTQIKSNNSFLHDNVD
jgi:cell division protein FtsZ